MEKRKKTIKPAALILAAAVLVAVIAAGFFYFRSRVERGPASALENALSQWTEEWKSGDSRALSEGMIFAASPQEEPEIDEAEDGALSAEELKAIMEERYSDPDRAPGRSGTGQQPFPHPDAVYNSFLYAAFQCRERPNCNL